MLIPLGFLGASGSSGAASDFELIATAYGTGSSGVISFSSIPQTYKHLQVRAVTKNTGSGAGTTNNNLTFNGVTTGYAQHLLTGNGSTVTSTSGTNQSSIGAIGTAVSTVAGAMHGMILDVLDYSSTSKNTTVRMLAGRLDGSTSNTVLLSGLFNNTAAISSMTFTLTNGNFATTTRFSLYGIKG